MAAPVARRPLRIALAHDWLVGMRGGERVLDRLALLAGREHRGAVLYTLFDDGRPLTTSIDRLPRRVSKLGKLPVVGRRGRRWLLPLYPRGVRELSRMLAADHRREPFDLVLSSSSAAVKGLAAPEGRAHVCYCHAPARYLWSQREEYAKAHRAAALGLALLGPALRTWDRRSSGSVTHFVANSRYIAGEIARCYGREAMVVHPPVRTDFFTPHLGLEREDVWLFAGALEPYKRVDLAIAAAHRAGARLFVAGEGSLRKRLRSDDRVTLLGRVSDHDLRDLFRRVRVLIFPQIEDFGIIAVEAQACGCPVVARAAGGTLDTVVDGRTGALFEEATPEAIVEAVRRAPERATAACRAQAELFSEARFDEAMRGVIARAVGE
ncbi:MAG: glycosyltransferase [Phycisphaeraceae bacterium]|nr:glycosyltransferase [Phycisphaeraceae bacterium]